jgi:CheY-like chemotaxis protein
VTHKLLLADDSVTIQRVVELTFSGEDVQVVTVGDGEQAIARIPVEHPDIVLADIGMPKRSGYEVAAFVKGRPDLSHIPVLLLAGAFEPVDEARALQVKSDGVLVKPFEPQQVISRVRELIDGGRPKAPHTIDTTPIAATFEHRMPERRASQVEAPRTPNVEPGTPNVEHRPSNIDHRTSTVEHRTSHVEHRPSNPEPRTAAVSPDPALSSEDYFDFDRLDAAFARLGSDADLPEPSRMSRERHDYGAGFDVPTVDSLLASAPLHDMPASAVTRAPLPQSELPTHSEAPAPSPDIDAGAAGGRNVIADVFNALFAMEQGESDATPIRLAPSQPGAPAITDELIDEVTRRVVQRLAPGAAHDLVAKIVSEVAERLVREEIARIKSAVANRR